MKKSLFWMLSALAVSGLFTLAACDEDESEDVGVCDASVDPCASRTDGKTICNVVQGQAVCAIRLGCDGSDIMGLDGLCTSPEPTGTACNADGTCSEEGYSCVDGVCQYVPNTYKYVRIDDLDPKCKLGSDGKCEDSVDPGADIDAIALIKSGKSPVYASSVRGYKRADGVDGSSDVSMAANPERAIGKPDAFLHYPDPDGVCYYYPQGVNAKNDATAERTYVSLGGLGGYLIVEMPDAIENNDRIDVLEIGDCTLYNTKDKPSEADTKAKKAESVKVQVSVTDTVDGAWKVIGNLSGQSASKGIISLEVTGL